MKILNFGSLNVDNVYSVDHFIRPGETMSTLNMEVFCGGKGLNQSLAMARAGAKVYHAGAVGKEDGGRLLQILKESGVDIGNIRQTDGVSGHTVIQVERGGQNCILLYGGANREITREQIDGTLAQFDAGDILLLQNEINEIGYLIECAKRRGMKVFLNPSPVTRELLTLPLDQVDLFILNEVEGADICGENATIEAMPSALLEAYPNSVILLTLGSRGSIYYDGKNRYEQAAFPVKAVDTTGAGDTFTGYFIACTAGGEDIPASLKKASEAASLAVMKKGAAASIPWKQEVEALYADKNENRDCSDC